ncbi:DinB family protein [Glycomyces luteolus]|uniref:DinB family protein n=1 Tax=Glycomyces luteolus TaxID=2670330 RepID=A0A9X3P8T3_9ACTN|nr:DinB family protein [Glycomyces luteolus]MDA1359063.1 DinB family protein [Glycomyces luteolus]
MAMFNRSDDLEGAEFTEVNLRGARFVESDLSGAVMRGVEVKDADIDSPWLSEGQRFHVNGIDVVPFVEAELDRRFPGRAERRSESPEGLRAAWAKLEHTWAATVERAGAMPPGTVDVSVDGEWSFAQTLRHLVFATDLWLGLAVLGADQPIHPIGLMHVSAEDDPGQGRWAFVRDTPSYAEVLEVRASRVALVRDFLAAVTPGELATPRPNPHHPKYEETTLSCLHTILDEEWEHHRFAVRDLDAIEAG